MTDTKDPLDRLKNQSREDYEERQNNTSSQESDDASVSKDDQADHQSDAPR